ELFIGEIVAAYTEERYLTDGIPDLRKMSPFVLMMPQKMYAGIGSDIAPAWKVGENFLNQA
ncbi:MAG: hypothetical protein C0407_09990, partial [Desulfobacca sp.]|nr:hypothetical protein [Desulfobacca sp.]